jgi:SAM-dependent methyltransferase
MAWFENWFDSKYYHRLYQNRDEAEARAFIDALLAELSPAASARMLDLACGKGRHARYLADKGFEVVGLDLSIASIEHARQFERDKLSFFSHDMRLPFRNNFFNYIFNFFTSFGYFATEKEHLDVLRNVRKGLRANGIFVMDFFNAHKAIAELVPEETKTLDGTTFHLQRRLENGILVKDIRFADAGRIYHFAERVHAFTLPDFERMFKLSGLQIRAIYGDYALSPFDAETSPRLIMVASKATDQNFPS